MTGVVPIRCARSVATGAPTATDTANGSEATPNSNGVYSRTPWKYWVIRNRKPNIEKYADRDREGGQREPAVAEQPQVEDRVLGAQLPARRRAERTAIATGDGAEGDGRRPAVVRGLDDRPHEHGDSGDRGGDSDEVHACRLRRRAIPAPRQRRRHQRTHRDRHIDPEDRVPAENARAATRRPSARWRSANPAMRGPGGDRQRPFPQVGEDIDDEGEGRRERPRPRRRPSPARAAMTCPRLSAIGAGDRHDGDAVETDDHDASATVAVAEVAERPAAGRRRSACRRRRPTAGR